MNNRKSKNLVNSRKELTFLHEEKTNDFKPWSMDENSYYLFFNKDKDVYMITHFGSNNGKEWDNTWEFYGWDEVSQWVYENLWC